VGFTSLVLIIDLLTNHRGIPSKSASSLPISSSPHLQHQPLSSSPSTCTPQGVLPRQSSNVIQTIIIKTLTERTVEISEAGLLGKPVSYLSQVIESKTGVPPPQSSLVWKGRLLGVSSRALADYGIASGDSILLLLKLRGGKPVIYLFPPSSLPNVTTELLLTPSWHFSAVYPSPQTTVPFGKNEHSQCVTWAVAAEPGGTLFNKSTGTEVSYLYWEAM